MTIFLRFLSVLVLTSVSLIASAATQSQLHMQRLGFRNGEVTTYLTLVAEDGTPILGKSTRDFKLQVEGGRTESALNLITFAQTKEPVQVIAVVQLTATMSLTLEDLRKDVRQLAQAVGAVPGSQMGLISYGADVKSLVEMESSDHVLSALNKLTCDPPSPDTKILNALRRAIALISYGKGTRKLIVLFSDGSDEKDPMFNKKDFAGLGQQAESAGVVIDSIYYGVTDSSRPRKMSELSKRSHGVERYVPSAAEASRKLADLISEINEQYVVTFPPAWSEPSHRLQVRLNDQNPIYGNIIEARIPSCCSPPPRPRPGLRDRWPEVLFVGMLLAPVFWLGRKLLRRGRR